MNNPHTLQAKEVQFAKDWNRYSCVRPIKPDKHRSHRERKFRDQVMTAVRKKIYAERIPCADIIVSGRPMLTAVRARILRGDIDDISLSRALLIADAVGLDLNDDLVQRPAPPAPEPAPAGPTAAQVLAQIIADARAAQEEKAARKAKRSPVADLPSLFDYVA